MMLLNRLTGKDKKQAAQQKQEQSATETAAPPPYPQQQHGKKESKEDDLYSGFGAEEVAAPLQTEDLEYDEGFQVKTTTFWKTDFVLEIFVNYIQSHDYNNNNKPTKPWKEIIDNKSRSFALDLLIFFIWAAALVLVAWLGPTSLDSDSPSLVNTSAIDGLYKDTQMALIPSSC